MARAIWTGSLSFGLVNVPVGMYAAVEDHAVHFHQFQAGTSDRIRYRHVNERTGKEVPRDKIVRGVAVEDGEYVLVSDEELDAIAPEKSQTIDITDFVDLEEIDPIQYRTTYYLAPRGKGAARPYALLRAAMEDTSKVGIALFVQRGRESLVAIRPDRQVLALETMYFADEIRDPARVLPDLPNADFDRRELATAGQLIQALSVPWDPSRYHSTYREELAALIERKRQGETVSTTEEAGRQPAKVVDLMEALEASLERSGRGRGRGSGGKARQASRSGSRTRKRAS